jgi:hypothetical protein
MKAQFFDPRTQTQITPPAQAELRTNSYSSSGELKLSLQFGGQTIILSTTMDDWLGLCESVRQLVYCPR